MRVAVVLALFLATRPAVAECPPAPDIDAAEAALLAQIQEAGNDMAARAVSNRLWELWTTAPDEPAQALLDRGIQARESYDYLGALDALNQLTEYCPDYAEGYNQRAFVRFLRQDFPAALVDLDRALDLRPAHLGALSGKALTLMGLGRQEEAQRVLREAVRLNPWLPERGLLVAPEGEDL